MKRFCSKILGSEMDIGFIFIGLSGLAMNAPVLIDAKRLCSRTLYASEAVPIDHQHFG